jgi:hypothetical protein
MSVLSIAVGGKALAACGHRLGQPNGGRLEKQPQPWTEVQGGVAPLRAIIVRPRMDG